MDKVLNQAKITNSYAYDFWLIRRILLLTPAERAEHVPGRRQDDRPGLASRWTGLGMTEFSAFASWTASTPGTVRERSNYHRMAHGWTGPSVKRENHRHTLPTGNTCRHLEKIDRMSFPQSRRKKICLKHSSQFQQHLC